MTNRIENFMTHVRNAPRPSGELIEVGAYPVRTAGEWTVPVERFFPIMDAYLRRSAALSSARAKMSSVFLTDFLTNESDYPSVLSSLDRVGGVYVGTTRALSFTFPAVQKASHAFVVDQDAKVPFGFTAVWGALLCMAPTRARFLSLLLGMPLPLTAPPQYREMDGKELIFQIWSRPQNAGFANAVAEAISKTAVLDAYPYSRSAVEESKKGLLRFESAPQLLDVLAKKDGTGRGGILSSEAAYQKERRLFLEGRMTGVAADIAGPEMQNVFSAIRALGQKVGVIYVSNIEHWLWEEFLNSGVDFERIRSFYRLIAALGEKGTPSTQIISSLHLYPAVTTVPEFLARVASDESLSELEAGQVFKLRDILIKIMRDARNGGKSTRELLGAISEVIWNVYGTMLRDVHAIEDEFPIDREEFERRMSKRSEAYRAIEPRLREKVLIFLTDMGVIRPLAPRHRPVGEVAAAAMTARGQAPYHRMLPAMMPQTVTPVTPLMTSFLGMPVTKNFVPF